MQGGRTALLIAAAEGQTAVVEHLIQIDPTSIDACTSSGNTALHRAAAYGHAAVVRALIKGGAVIDSLNEEGSTPLARACRWGHDDVVKTLVHAGADPSVADRSGRTPAQWASLKGWTEVTAAMANERPHAHHLSKSANTVSLRGQGLLPGGTTSSSPSGTASVAQADPIAEVDHPMDGDEDDDDVHGSGGAGQYGGPVRVEGWMAKQGHFIRNWKNRWFSLEGRRIYYFGKEGAAKPKGCINMVAGTDVIIEERYSKPYCFTLITPTKKFILQVGGAPVMHAMRREMTMVALALCCHHRTFHRSTFSLDFLAGRQRGGDGGMAGGHPNQPGGHRSSGYGSPDSCRGRGRRR